MRENLVMPSAFTLRRPSLQTGRDRLSTHYFLSSSPREFFFVTAYCFQKALEMKSCSLEDFFYYCDRTIDENA